MKRKIDRVRLFKEKELDDRFEDFTNTTAWERFITDLQLNFGDWQKNQNVSEVATQPLCRTLIGSTFFDSFEFKMEHCVVQPFPSTTLLDSEDCMVLLAAFSYDLHEFVLISPANPNARRLVGNTRIRLILSGIEMALATSNSKLPLLASYGEEKLLYGLSHLKGTGAPTDSLLVPDFSRKRLEFSMARAPLDRWETHLARFVEIFLEKLGRERESLDISVLQYFRMINLKFRGLSKDGARKFLYAPIKLFSSISLDIQLNLITETSHLHSRAINDDLDFRLVKPSLDDWYVDCVLADAPNSLFAIVYGRLLQTVLEADASSTWNSDGKKYIFPDISPEWPDVPHEYLTSQIPTSAELDNFLRRSLGLAFHSSVLRSFLTALHVETLLESTNDDYSPLVSGVWNAFLEHLRFTSKPLLIHSSATEISDPIDRDLLTVVQHSATHPEFSPSASDGRSKMEHSDEFFDALEDHSTHHSGSSGARDCEGCRGALERLQGQSSQSVAKWILPYLLAFHIRLLHCLDLPSRLTPWYAEKLSVLREKVATNPTNQRLLRRQIHDTHRRLICAISLDTYLDSCGALEALPTLTCELADRLHIWNLYKVPHASDVDYFNISKKLALPLGPETRDPLIMCITSVLRQPPPTAYAIYYQDGSETAELHVERARLRPFPSHRLVTIAAKQGCRRPCPHLSGPSPQRMLVAVRYPMPFSDHDDEEAKEAELIGLDEKIAFIQSGESPLPNQPDTARDRKKACQVYMAGYFGEDCDII